MKKETDVQKCLRILKRVGMYGIHSFHLNQEIGTFRAAARIKDLQDKGYIITSTPERLGDAVGVRYFLQSSPVVKQKEKPVYQFDPVRQVYVML